MQVQRKNSSRLIDRLIIRIGFIVLITMSNSASAQSPSCQGNVDLFLIIDASRSNTNQEFQKICEFVVSVCNKLNEDLGSSLRIGVLFFATEPYPPLAITDKEDEVLKYLKAFVREDSNLLTYLGKALNKVLEEFRSTWKPSAYKRVLVVTDGNANDRTDVQDALREFRQNDVNVVVVGINTDVSYITDTMSTNVNDVNELTEDIADQVSGDICIDTAGSTGPIVPPDYVDFSAFFAIDESHGSTEKFGISKDFVEEILRTFVSGGNVSVLKYGENVFTTPPNIIIPTQLGDEFFSALNQLKLNPLNIDGRNLLEALVTINVMLDDLPRYNVGKIENPVFIVIMMTNISDEPEKTISRLRNILYDHNGEIYFIVIGLGTTNTLWMDQMNQMASYPSLVFTGDTFESITGETEDSKSLITNLRQSMYELATGTYESTTSDVHTWSSKVDILMLSDGSMKMSTILYPALVKTMISGITKSIELGPNAGQVGVMVFDSGGMYALIDSSDNEFNQFEAALYDLSFIQRTENGDINVAFEESLAYFESSGRENAVKIAMLFTRGGPYNMELSQAYYRTMAMRGIQLMIIAVDVTEEDVDALNATMLGVGYLSHQVVTNMASTENIDLLIADVQSYAGTPAPRIYPPWPDTFDHIAIVDNRLAVGDGGYGMKSILIDIANRLTNEPSSRLGVIIVGGNQRQGNEIRLTDSQSRENLTVNIFNLDFSFSGGGSTLLEALELAESRFDTDGRVGVNKVMTLFLSGDRTIDDVVKNKATELKEIDGIGISVFYNGPGADRNQFRMLAFHPQLAKEMAQPFQFTPKSDANLIALARKTYEPDGPKNDFVLDAPCYAVADIIFLLDASVSMDEHFDVIKQSVTTLMYPFEMARFGIYVYGSVVLESSITLGKYDTYLDYYHAVMALQPDEFFASTYTDVAITKVIEEFNSGGENVVVIMTDAFSQNDNKAKQASDDARINGTTIMALGYGNQVQEEALLDIAGSPENMFLMNEGDLQMKLMDVQARLCEIIRPGKCPAGKYRNEQLECLPCDVGYYQPEEEKLSCIKCPAGKSTQNMQTVELENCIEICDAGEYFNTECLLCPVGTYKNNSGPEPCMDCPEDKPNTLNTGSKSIDDCLSVSTGCATPMDIFIMIDVSASIDNAAIALKLFLLDLLKKFNLGPTNVQVAFATIKDETKPEDMTEFLFTDDDVFFYLFNELIADGAFSTNTASALDMVRTKVKDRNRNDAPAIVLSFTDGRSNNRYLTALKAALLRLWAQSIVIGVGDFVDVEELSLIASKPEHIITGSKFSDLANLDIVGTICKAAEEWMPYSPPVETLCNLPIDLLFVMDMSESTSSNSQSLMLGLTILVNQLYVEDMNLDMRIGVTSYGEMININTNFQFSSEKNEIIDTIKSQITNGIKTNTHLIIPHTRNLFIEHARENAFQLTAYFTDGRSSHPDLTLRAANDFRYVGGKSIAVGPDGADLNELQALSSVGIEKVVTVPTFAALNSNLILNAVCPEKFTCSYPMDVVLILYLNDATLLPEASQFLSNLEERFPQMKAILIQKFASEGTETLPTSLGIAFYQIQSTRTDTIRSVIVMTDTDLNSTNQTSLTQEVNNIKDKRMMLTFIVSGDNIEAWRPFATTELNVFSNQNFSEKVASANIYWSLCNEPCDSGYELINSSCEKCSADTYRDKSSSFECVACDSDRSTRNKTGSTSSKDCYLNEDKCFGGFELLVNSSCKPCPLGTIRIAFEQAKCTKCPDGFITIFIGSGSVEECVSLCDVGHFWSSENNACMKCDPGTYSNKRNQTACTPCHENNLMTTVDDSGTIIVSGATSVEQCAGDCDVGHFWNESLNNGECVPCLEDTYQHLLYRNECAACRPGQKSDPGSASEADCLDPCDSGYTWDFVERKCVPCGTGKYRNNLTDNICHDCPPGSSTDTDTADSKDLCKYNCPSGTVWNENKLNCFECLPGTYTSSSDKCESCPDGMTSPLGSDEETDCKPICFKGHYWNMTTGQCIPCPIGTYQDMENELDCIPCGLGYSTLNIGSDDSPMCITNTGSCDDHEWTCLSDQDCVAGSSRCDQNTDCQDESDEMLCDCDQDCSNCFDGFSDNQIYCIRCPAGTNPSADQSTCTDMCPPGQKRASDSCVDCEKGSYGMANRDDPSTCILCPSPFTTEFAGSKDIDECCAECLPGEFYNPEKRGCDKCSVGYYQSGTFDEYDCTRCPPGTATIGTGSVTVGNCSVKCPGGEELPLEGTTVEDCKLCTAGTYKDDIMTLCEPCEDGLTSLPGSDSSGDCYRECTIGQEIKNDTSCADCELGTYRSTSPIPGDSKCIPCAGGNGTYFKKSCSEEDCKDVCNSGLELSEDKKECRTCGLGYYRQRYVHTECMKCPNSMTTLVVGSPNETYCVDKCKSGYESVNGSECLPCGFNRYRGKTDPQCLPCQDGEITLIEYATSIELCFPNCPPGKFINKTSSSCQNCSRKEYQDESGKTECKLCPNDFHNNGKEMSDPSHCKADWCDPGYYYEDEECFPCGFNFYRSDINTSCIACEQNEITFVQNASSSDMCHPNCNAGYFANTTTSTCQPCPQSTYQNVSGQDSCIICPNHFHTKDSGTVNEIDCRADWCENGYKYVQGVCIPCGYGFYRTVRDRECIPCDTGLSTLTDTASSKEQCQVIPTTVQPSTTQPTTVQPKKCSSKFDLVIAVDLSKSSCNDIVMRNLRTWFTDLVTRLDIHRNKIRVGIIRFGRRTSRLVDLRAGTSKKRLCSLLARGLQCSPYLSSNTKLALRDADFLFSRQSRWNCVRKMLLITAGLDACPENTTKVAYKLKTNNVHVTVISSDPVSGERIASNKDSLFVISDYSTLPPVDEVVQALCFI